MDQIRSGHLIAEERKKKGYTQRQLAEKLNISDKTISKWECGNGFPEVSLLLPLCDELGITVNDLLSGEIVPREDYQKKAENNMVEMIREREANKKQFTLTLLLGGVSLAAFLTLLIVVCVYTDVIPLTVKLILLAIACVIFTVGVTAVMEGQRKIGYYQCEKCGETFVPGFRTHLIGFNMVSRRFMKCPCCQKRAWCRKVMEKAQK
jgi:transcriptional regulator with XRE-family HTH domain